MRDFANTKHNFHLFPLNVSINYIYIFNTVCRMFISTHHVSFRSVIPIANCNFEKYLRRVDKRNVYDIFVLFLKFLVLRILEYSKNSILKGSKFDVYPNKQNKIVQPRYTAFPILQSSFRYYFCTLTFITYRVVEILRTV